ncbi:MAG: hypothetical protein OIN66_05990 [Candidatus Methanoperedens sp.]|nr:hypothetical protein [Candidatus Methanoperedens sp.]
MESDLQRSEGAFKKYEERFTEQDYYSDVGIVRASISIINEEYIKNRKIKPTKRNCDIYKEYKRKYIL